MASKSTLFLHPRNGLLRDFVNASQLKEYMENFGEVSDVWIPWKEHDNRYFGFATFKDPEVAKKFVRDSPHNFHKVDILVGFRHTERPREVNRANSIEVNSVLAPLSQGAEQSQHSSWHTYFAPERLKRTLMGIAEGFQTEHAVRVRNSRKALYGDETMFAPGIPLVLFYGPPGTGKTQAMKVIATESGLTPFLLNTRTLQQNSYEAPKLWERVLENISDLEGAAIFIDEAEILLGRRSVMSSYASVAVKSHQQMLETFLTWVDGLQTKTYEPGRAPLICMATNLKDNMDEAILDRTKVKVEFELPDFYQCTRWWAEHARQLANVEVAVLGRLSCVARLSFRDLWAVAECMVDRDAQKQKYGGFAGQIGFSEYAVEVMRRAWGNLSSLMTILHKAQTALWTTSTVVFLLDNMHRVMRRARL